MIRRRAVAAAASALLSRAAGAQQTGNPMIGTAWMEADGTIILDLVARSGARTGDGRLVYPPDYPDRGMIRRHLGGLRPGETRPVPPFP